MQSQTTPTAWRNDAPLVARTLSTEQAAAALHIRPQTLRAAVCRERRRSTLSQSPHL